MIWRLILAIGFLVLAVQEFFYVGSAAAAVVQHPSELVDALLSGDRSVGPWLLGAYGVLMLVRAWAHRPKAGGAPPVGSPRRSQPARARASRPAGGPPTGSLPPGGGRTEPAAPRTPSPPGSDPAGTPRSAPSGRPER